MYKQCDDILILTCLNTPQGIYRDHRILAQSTIVKKQVERVYRPFCKIPQPRQVVVILFMVIE